MMPEPNNKPELLKRSLAGKINYREIALTTDKFDEKTRKLTVSFASQTPVFMYGDSEVLEVSEKAMDISRFEKSVMPVLFNHNRDEPIAAIQKIWIEGEKAYADIIFDDDEDSLKIMNKVKSGSVRGTSVGYRVQNYEIIQANNQSSDGIAGPAYIARKWEVLEFSIVTVPADPEVGAGRSADNPEDVPDNKIQ
jgi:HK97 family phage prohead protease